MSIPMYPNYQMPMYPNNFNPTMAVQQRLQQMEQQYPQLVQQNQVVPNVPLGIQGKMVSDFETVKATETPLDGSISYFPLVNGEYIYTKFLNMNTGSSDYAVYKRVVENQDTPKEEFDIKAYLDEKFETLKNELKGGAKNARKSTDKSDSNNANE